MKDDNHARYWNDISEMYEILTVTYGYDPGNVFVLYADGNPPSSSNCADPAHVYSSYPTGIIDYSATRSNLQAVCSYIAANDHPKDTLFVFSTDHGYKPGAYSYLILWYDLIRADDFASSTYLGQITQYTWRAFEMEQCYSGDFIPYLSGPKTATATACAADELSWSMIPPLYYDEFCYYFNSALKGETPFGTTVDADANDDGRVSFQEAFNYAETYDGAPETPQYDDNGDGVPHTGQMPSGGDGPFGSTVYLGLTHCTLSVSSGGNGTVTEPGEGSYTYPEGDTEGNGEMDNANIKRSYSGQNKGYHDKQHDYHIDKKPQGYDYSHKQEKEPHGTQPSPYHPVSYTLS